MYVLYIQRTRKSGLLLCAVSRNTPLRLEQAFWAQGVPAIVTSGTLAAGGSFAHTRQAMGLSDSKRNTSFTAASPFDYEQNCLLYFPKAERTGEETAGEETVWLAEQISLLVRATHGHTLVLFTSYHLMDAVHRKLTGQLPFPCLQAWRGGQQVVQQFKALPNAVLFAAGPCWEGVDFPGDCVSSLILPRLPFPVPDAVSESERGQYPSLPEYIQQVIVPEMQKKLRQGFGRAIRTETDTCVVSILDRRAAPGGRYHQAALDALPPCGQGAKFQSMTINRILKDRQYLGYLVTKDVTSPHLPELQIIDEDTFRMAGEIVRQRKAVNAEWRSIPRQSGNGALLAGNLYCAHCGSRMTSSCPGEGAKRLRAEYICYKDANRRIQCNGQRAYVAEKVDAVVLEVTQELMNMISTIPKDDALEKQMKAQIKKLSQELTDAKKAASAAAAEQQALEMEIGRCLLGQSRFSEETLSNLITEKAAERKRLQNRAAELERSLKDQQGLTEGISTYYNRFQGWSAEFRLADRNRKRFIISQLYSRIELHRNYEIRFVLDANYQQFLEGRQSTAVQDFVERMARLSLHMSRSQMPSA